jgi:hypothetical protein
MGLGVEVVGVWGDSEGYKVGIVRREGLGKQKLLAMYANKGTVLLYIGRCLCIGWGP